MDILAEKIPARLGRYNPRVVKKPGVEVPIKEASSQGKWNSTLLGSTFPFPIPHRAEQHAQFWRAVEQQFGDADVAL